MARLFTALLLFFLASTPIWAEDFRNARFGMSPKEVQATEENADWETPEKNVLAFNTELGGFDASAGYIFINEKFVRGTYLITEEYQNNNEYLRDFEYLNNLLTKKYGAPKENKTKWIDDRWKDHPARHGYALWKGEFSKYSEWKNKTTLITHGIYAEDYVIIHRIDYESLNMPDVEEEKLLDDL